MLGHKSHDALFENVLLGTHVVIYGISQVDKYRRKCPFDSLSRESEVLLDMALQYTAKIFKRNERR